MNLELNNKIQEELMKNMGTLEIGDDPQNMKEVGKVKNMNIAFVDEVYEITKFHCTVIQKKKNKALSGRYFAIEGLLNDEQINERLQAHYIALGVVGKLQKQVQEYFEQVAQGKIEHTREDLHFIFQLFDARFRFIISK